MSDPLREDLASIPRYVPGKAIPDAVKLSSNEVPYGPLPGVVEAITEAAEGIHRYPDLGVVQLRDVLADRLGLPRRAHRHRHRLGRPHRAPHAGGRRPRRRSRLLLALLRGLPDRGHGRRPQQRPGAEHRRPPPRRGRHDRRRRARHAGDPHLQPQQPDRTGLTAEEIDRVFDAVPEDRPRRDRRGLPRVRDRPGLPGRDRALLRTARTRSSSAPSPRPGAWPDSAWATWWPRPRSPGP